MNRRRYRSFRCNAAGVALLISLVVCPVTASAQDLELTGFIGRAFPTVDDRLVLRLPSVPVIPGIDVTASGTPELRADGGPVFGGSLAFHFGVLGIEGRVDVADIGFNAIGARYDLRATEPPFEGLTGSVTLGNGRFDVNRLALVSANLRVRTPGPVGLVVSGGLSYLPDFTVSGSLPVSAEIGGTTVLPGVEPRLRLVASPGDSRNRWGVNGGAGLRIGGRIAVIGEARVFYFRSYDLRLEVDQPFPEVSDLLATLPVIRFRPIIVNAQAGLSFRF